MLHFYQIFIHLIFIATSLANKDKRFNCPNDGIPKEENGKIVQCLPGRASSAICGPDHSCFFSGFNYQCCPSSNDKDNDIVLGEECSGNALVVLDSNGLPSHCDESGECPSRGMFCYGGICCEYFKLNGGIGKEKAVGDPRQTAAGTQIRRLIDGNIAPKKIQLGFNSNPNMLEPVTTTEKNENDSARSGEFTIFDDNDGVASLSVKEQLKEGEKEVSEKIDLNVKNHKNEYAPPKSLIGPSQPKNGMEESAKQFLLEQIKEGWPYSEKYYRPANTEDIMVLRNRGRPEAIVHFPNWP